jgi:hypothetical protein
LGFPTGHPKIAKGTTPWCPHVASAAGEKRRAIEDDADARAAFHLAVLAFFERPHFRNEVEQK